jgi:tetratricopeptide (TPR) repeat protein
LGTLVPVIGLVNWGNQAMADRFVYIPFIGLYIAVSWGLSELLTKCKLIKNWFVVATIILASTLSILSWQQVGYWKNSVTLFENSLNKTRNNYLIHNNLGVTLELEDRTEEAIVHYRQALKIWPDYADAHNNLGFALSKQGQIAKAIKHYQLALKKRPGFAKAHNNMGNALYKLGRFDEAIEHYAKALEITPSFADAHNNIGSALFRKGMTNKAVEHYLEALRINPEHFEANNNLMKIRMLKKPKNK